MAYVILIRNTSNDSIHVIEDYDDLDKEMPRVAVFETYEAAEEAATVIPACRAWPYAIVEAP
jgi:hypothetical protein